MQRRTASGAAFAAADDAETAQVWMAPGTAEAPSRAPTIPNTALAPPQDCFVGQTLQHRELLAKTESYLQRAGKPRQTPVCELPPVSAS
jgi:hypothetical protein